MKAAGVVTTLAGIFNAFTGSTDGLGSIVRFSDSHGLAIDGRGNLCVADTNGRPGAIYSEHPMVVPAVAH